MILNDEQLVAINQSGENIFLLAGAGSGKTRVIVEKINKLLLISNPEDILCITFTVKSADEMKKRLKNEGIFVSTFHAYAYKILSDYKKINIYEPKGEFSHYDLLNFANYKNSLKQIEKPKRFDIYEKYLNDNQLMDFDDLLLESLHIKHPKFKYIFIDEFQDTNLLQYELLKKIYTFDSYIFAVGDPDQSIYKFRGAKVELISKYVIEFNAKVLRLEQNYRSTASIIGSANNLIKHNINRFKKRLITNSHKEGITKLIIGDDKFLKDEIIKLCRTNYFKEIAILYRNHYQVNKLKQDLERNYIFNIKYLSFHEAKGLEFETVFIYGAQILPYDKSNTFSQTEEERRLFFVGVTRAKVNLVVLSNYKTRFINQLKIKDIIIQ